jgi:hypothetical protein
MVITIKNDEKKVYSPAEWKKEARLLIRTELVRRDMSYKDLARLLEGIGVSFDPKSLSNKVSRGTFSAVFFLQCMHVLDVEAIQLPKSR